MFKYPYGDSQQLNLDWIIQKIKELEAGGGGGSSDLTLEEVANALISLTYNSGTAYQRYDYCYLQGKLYRALANTSGPFDPASWMEVRIGDDIPVLTRLLNAVDTSLGTLQTTVGNLVDNVDNLDSSDIENASSQVSGSTVTDALDNLNGVLKSSQITNIAGQKISIIGDSISTYDAQGYKYDSYEMYYPSQWIPDVTSVKDTWWFNTLVASGAELVVNASYSGSRAVKASGQTTPSLYERAQTSIIGNPDMVFVALGTNDWNANIQIGAENTWDYTSAIANINDATFGNACIKGIKQLKSLGIDVVWIIFQMGDTYKNTIKKICNQLGAKWIDASDYAGAVGVHPGKKGMRQIASIVSSGGIDDGINSITFPAWSSYFLFNSDASNFVISLPCGNLKTATKYDVSTIDMQLYSFTNTANYTSSGGLSPTQISKGDTMINLTYPLPSTTLQYQKGIVILRGALTITPTDES